MRASHFFLVSFLALSALAGCAPETVSTDRAPGEAPPASSASSTTLAGRLLLPGEGSRGDVELRVDLRVWVAGPDGEEHLRWIFPHADGRFEWETLDVPTRLSVHAGAEVHRIDTVDLPTADASGRIDLGSIDLRESLTVWRLRLRASEGAPGGAVRIGRWIGPPHTGPFGEPPSLGSKQFPTVELGDEVEWLLPPDASAVHFLVERPSGPGRGVNWRSGEQRLFGPFDAPATPLELFVD